MKTIVVFRMLQLAHSLSHVSGEGCLFILMDWISGQSLWGHFSKNFCSFLHLIVVLALLGNSSSSNSSSKVSLILFSQYVLHDVERDCDRSFQSDTKKIISGLKQCRRAFSTGGFFPHRNVRSQQRLWTQSNTKLVI